jgi:hypothetical protein
MGLTVGLYTAVNQVVSWYAKHISTQDDTYQILWDTGASKTLTFDQKDFIEEIEWFRSPQLAVGIASGLKSLGKGKIRWHIRITESETMTIELEAYYCPAASRRLLCPQQLVNQLKQRGERQVKVEVEDTHLTFCHGERILYVSYDPTNNLPISQGLRQPNEETTRDVQEAHSLVTSTRSQNLSNAQKELLRNHFKFGHLSMQRIQAALRTGALARSKTERALHLAASKCEIPKCAACQFAKACKRPLQGQRIKQDNSEKEGNLKKNVLLPGQCVACDHFVSSAKGRLFTGFGKTEASKMYSGACVFTDLATGYMHVEPQVSFDSSETLQATARFEALMKEYGITVSKYMFDNGSAFASSEYKTKLAEQQQKSQRAGVGAHSQNIAE